MKFVASVILVSTVLLWSFSIYAAENTKPSPVKRTASSQQQKAQDKEVKESNGKSKSEMDMDKWIYLSMGLIMGIGILGGTIAQGIVGAKVVSGIARNPGAKPAVMSMMILIMALIESIVIYGLVVTILLYAKL